MGIDTLVVLAAGAGRRFGGGKQLAAVGPAGETLMDYTIFLARQAGFRRVVVVTRAAGDGAMRAHFAGAEWVELARQPAGVAGTVPAVLAARSQVGDEGFAVVNADDLYPRPALEAMRRGGWPEHALIGFRLDATVLPGAGGAPVNRGLCRLAGGDDHRLVGLAEAALRRRDGGWVATGRDGSGAGPVDGEQLVSMNGWVFAPSIWGHLESAEPVTREPVTREPVSREPVTRVPLTRQHEEVLLPVVVDALVARGVANVTVVPVEGSCVGVTWPDDLPLVQVLIGELIAAGDLPARIGVSR